MIAVGIEKAGGRFGLVIGSNAIPEEETFNLRKVSIIVDTFFLPVEENTTRRQSLLLYYGEKASQSRVLKFDPKEIVGQVSLEEIFQDWRPDLTEEEIQKGRLLTPKDITVYSELVEWYERSGLSFTPSPQ